MGEPDDVVPLLHVARRGLTEEIVDVVRAQLDLVPVRVILDDVAVLLRQEFKRAVIPCRPRPS